MWRGAPNRTLKRYVWQSGAAERVECVVCMHRWLGKSAVHRAPAGAHLVAAVAAAERVRTKRLHQASTLGHVRLPRLAVEEAVDNGQARLSVLARA